MIASKSWDIFATMNAELPRNEKSGSVSNVILSLKIAVARTSRWMLIQSGVKYAAN